MKKIKSRVKYVVFIGLFWMGSIAHAELLDQIIAVVEDDIILERELAEEVETIVRTLKKNNVMIPPPFILRKQVLDRLIMTNLQKQLATRSGIRVSNEMLSSSVRDIARRNNLSVEAFRNELKSQGMNYQGFEENIRTEIIINQLRAREIGTRIKVTNSEISHYLETQGKIDEESVQYNLGHILISLPEGASSKIIKKAKHKANRIVKDLREGADFKRTAVAVSDGDNALKGGELGWRQIGQIPTLFVDSVVKMAKGDVADLIRSPSGFHIIKLLNTQGIYKHFVTKTRVRHILVKTNELIDDKEAKRRLTQLKNRILDGDEFTTLAQSNSDDRGSALKGGSLGWVGAG